MRATWRSHGTLTITVSGLLGAITLTGIGEREASAME